VKGKEPCRIPADIEILTHPEAKARVKGNSDSYVSGEYGF